MGKSLRSQVREVVVATFREVRQHPALLAAVVMRPLGYRWRGHRWVDRPGDS